jgi:hypothetical protein
MQLAASHKPSSLDLPGPIIELHSQAPAGGSSNHRIEPSDDMHCQANNGMTCIGQCGVVNIIPPRILAALSMDELFNSSTVKQVSHSNYATCHLSCTLKLSNSSMFWITRLRAGERSISQGLPSKSANHDLSSGSK